MSGRHINYDAKEKKMFLQCAAKERVAIGHIAS